MRGILALFFGSEHIGSDVARVLVVCSGDPVHSPQILSAVRQRFPGAHFTYVAPREYVRFLPPGADIRLISDLKKAKYSTLHNIRTRKYDIAVLMLTGQPIFRKAKAWTLLTNYGTLLVYNENLDSFPCKWRHRKAVLGHLKWRLAEKGYSVTLCGLLKVCLAPVGVLYLVAFTAWVFLRRWMSRREEIVSQ